MSWYATTMGQSPQWGYRPVPHQEYSFADAFGGLTCWQAPTGHLSIIMASLARYCGMKRCVEIGVWYGATSVCLAAAMRDTDGLYVGVDQSVDRGVAAIKQAGLEKWGKFLEGKSDKVEYDGEPIDLLFIDGGHEPEVVSSDWRRWSGWVKRSGYIVFDNYESEVGVKQFLQRLLNDRMTITQYEILTDPRSYGFAILHRKASA